MLEERSRPKKKLKDDMVRIIFDVRHAKHDYYLPLEQAKRLFEDGHLGLMKANGSKWDYCHVNGCYVAFRPERSGAENA